MARSATRARRTLSTATRLRGDRKAAAKPALAHEDRLTATCCPKASADLTWMYCGGVVVGCSTRHACIDQSLAVSLSLCTCAHIGRIPRKYITGTYLFSCAVLLNVCRLYMYVFFGTIFFVVCA